MTRAPHRPHYLLVRYPRLDRPGPDTVLICWLIVYPRLDISLHNRVAHRTVYPYIAPVHVISAVLVQPASR